MNKLVNISVIVIAVFLVMGAGYYLGQHSNYNDGAVKMALADMTIHANELEHKQVEVNKAITTLATELKILKSAHVNNILLRYGL